MKSGDKIRTTPSSRTGAVLVVSLLLLLLSAVVYAAEHPCATCHEEPVAAMGGTPHAITGMRFCASCHGDPARHLETADAADIIGGPAIRSWSDSRKAGACLTCHRRDFPGWEQSPHAGEGICWNCHTRAALHFEPKGGALPPGDRRETFAQCTSCHKEVSAQFRRTFRHPVEEGVVACSDCHDVHGRVVGNRSSQHEMVPRERCLECHEEQAGPFLFEHPAMEEGCSSCHAAHGSPHRGLLLTRGNGMCVTCHMQGNLPHIGNVSHQFLLSGGGRCWDCHSEVHGSLASPDLNPRGRR